MSISEHTENPIDLCLKLLTRNPRYPAYITSITILLKHVDESNPNSHPSLEAEGRGTPTSVDSGLDINFPEFLSLVNLTPNDSPRLQKLDLFGYFAYDLLNDHQTPLTTPTKESAIALRQSSVVTPKLLCSSQLYFKLAHAANCQSKEFQDLNPFT
ncbi:hypothetical protein CPB83DRAFT_905681 [Crepidotus variabilis]|uniref:Uncharacterized protein n=1 Tax=Crepidotus variabilis TaxID=179855 RepID=A0A9P6JR22_9AGAR|nr:hypothetical protein CPB83DRAFT_905681 [Crepidotus variabilis]